MQQSELARLLSLRMKAFPSQVVFRRIFQWMKHERQCKPTLNFQLLLPRARRPLSEWNNKCLHIITRLLFFPVLNFFLLSLGKRRVFGKELSASCRHTKIFSLPNGRENWLERKLCKFVPQRNSFPVLFICRRAFLFYEMVMWMWNLRRRAPISDCFLTFHFKMKFKWKPSGTLQRLLIAKWCNRWLCPFEVNFKIKFFFAPRVSPDRRHSQSTPSSCWARNNESIAPAIN